MAVDNNHSNRRPKDGESKSPSKTSDPAPVSLADDAAEIESREAELDAAIEMTFPASDPPSFRVRRDSR